MTTYQETVLNARKKFLKLNKTQEKELLNLYKELANQLSHDISTCRTSSQDVYLRKLNEIVQVNINQLNSQLSAMVKANIETSSQIASTVESFYYHQITDDSVLSTMFNNSVLNTSRKTVSKLIQGGYYKDGKTLDQRLWNITKSNSKDIDTLIKVNVLKGANAKELAHQVNKYVNPLKKLELKNDEVGFSKNVSYQASRLARTSITHSFRETQIQQAMNNPFNIGMKWELSPSHGIRMHGKTDVCDDYAGQDSYGLGIGIFPVNKAPIGHPQCLCITYEVNTDIKSAMQELKAWSNGESNPELDKWYEKNYKDDNIIKYPKKEPKTNKWSNFKTDSTEFKNKKEVKKHLENEYNIKFSDSTKYPIHKDILQDSINWLDKFHNYFKGFKEIDPVELPAIKVKARMNAVGYYQYYLNKPQAVELALNGEYFTSKEYNINYISKCIESKWTVANAKPYKTFVHEYGHHIADSLKWLDKEKRIASSNWCKDFINETIKEYNDKYNEDISFKNIAELVSRYGGTKPEEAFAETFAEYFGGEKPRKFAQVFGEKVEKKLKEYIY